MQHYFIQGYPILSNCRSLSKITEFGAVLISRHSLTFLLIRSSSLIFACATSHRILWSFSISCLALLYLVSPLMTAHIRTWIVYSFVPVTHSSCTSVCWFPQVAYKQPTLLCVIFITEDHGSQHFAKDCFCAMAKKVTIRFYS